MIIHSSALNSLIDSIKAWMVLSVKEKDCFSIIGFSDMGTKEKVVKLHFLTYLVNFGLLKVH